MLDLAAFVGTLLGLGAVLGGQVLEGGSIAQITQLTAGLIVFGGTFGAMFLSFPMSDIRRAFGLLPRVYFDDPVEPRPLIDEIVAAATVARKEGVLALENQKSKLSDPMLRRGLQFVVDGFEPATVREILEAEIDQIRAEEDAAARVFEAAGGYAPTVGILGAVLGLIHVMSMLSEPSKIGEGIAVAFVATVYGVAAANLLLIPWGTKLRRRAALRARSRELVMVGILGIQEGLNPTFLREKLQVYGRTGA
jgi:chemotaxis protein MotA